MRIYLLIFLFLVVVFFSFYKKEGFRFYSSEYKANLFDSTQYPCVGSSCIKQRGLSADKS